MKEEKATYDLSVEALTSLEEQLKKVKRVTIDYVKGKCSHWLSLYDEFIKQSVRAPKKQREELVLEILALAIYQQVYSKQVQHLNLQVAQVAKYVSKARSKARQTKRIYSFLKGQLATKHLMKEQSVPCKKVQGIKRLERLILWLEASGEYPYEVIEFYKWLSMLKGQSSASQEAFLRALEEIACSFEKLGQENLRAYTEHVSAYRQKARLSHKNKEDFIFCLQPTILYHFNLLVAAVLNEAYRAAYCQTKKQYVLLPGCMCYYKKPTCKAQVGEMGFICQKCTLNCPVNKMSQLSEGYGAKTVIVYHESEFKMKSIKDGEKSIGIVGVACLLNLFEGGLKAKALGFEAQCVPLEYSGCKSHWCERECVTEIREEKLKSILMKEPHIE